MSDGKHIDQAIVSVNVDQLSHYDVAFMGDVILEEIVNGKVSRVLTGVIEQVKVNENYATFYLSGGHREISEMRHSGLVFGEGNDLREIIYSWLRSFGLTPDRLNIAGWDSGGRELFNVICPILNVDMAGSEALGMTTFTSTTPTNLRIPEDSDFYREFIGAKNWAWTIVEAETLFDAEVMGISKIDLAVCSLRALGFNRYSKFRGELREYNREQSRAIPQLGNIVYVGSTTSSRNWLRGRSNSLHQRALQVSPALATLESTPILRGESDQLLSRSLREWRLAADSDDEFEKASSLSRCIESYSARAQVPTLFDETSKRNILRAASSTSRLTKEQRLRVEEAFGMLNNAPVLTKFKHALNDDQIELTTLEFKVIRDSRRFRNELEHGAPLSSPKRGALENAIAVMNRVLLEAFFGEASCSATDAQ